MAGIVAPTPSFGFTLFRLGRVRSDWMGIVLYPEVVRRDVDIADVVAQQDVPDVITSVGLTADDAGAAVGQARRGIVVPVVDRDRGVGKAQRYATVRERDNTVDVT